jgi:hypothetical protein
MDTKLEFLFTQIPQIIRMCRLGNYGEAASGINRCIPLFQELLADKDIGLHLPHLVRKINYSLETVLLMLKNNDWVAVADVLEYELIVLLKQIEIQ